MLEGFDVEFTCENFMDLERLIPRACDKPFTGHLDTRDGRGMPPNNLQNIARLHIPREHLIGIKRPGKHNILGLIDLQARQLTLRIGLELPEPFILDNIISIDTAIQTAREKCVLVRELDISDGGLVLLESSQTKPAGLVPYLDPTVVGARGDQFVLIESDGLGLMDEPLLVDYVALGFPLPDDDLPEGLEPETDPCPRGVDGHCADLVLAHGECLHLG